MNRPSRRNAVLSILIATSLAVTGCATPPAAATKIEPGKVEAVGNTGVKRLTLTDKAVERLLLATAPVEQVADRLVIPYSALLYLPDGATFTYSNPDGHSYVREPVTVEKIVGKQAILTAGPKPGTAVVTVGGAELWGLEFGIK
jgi:hypothetical protein